MCSEDPQSSVPQPSSRVLFVSSNGAGMGHITRLLAIANRTSDAVEPVFLSMSQSVPAVADHGYAWDYCPSQKTLGISSGLWNPFFAERFDETLERVAPAAVVFDGTSPYQGIVAAARRRTGTRYVWSRRGMWRPGSQTRYFPPAGTFDLVIEPGEAAAEYDKGPTAALTDAVRVPPVTLLGEDDMLPRDRARAELGIDQDTYAVLLTLGAGNINDTRSDTEVFAEAARAEFPGATVYATRSPIAAASTAASHVTPISVYPLARALKAFDVVVAAAGYNVFHEALLARVPTVFVPNTSTTTDDQEARSRFAQDRGLGAFALSPDVPSARAALRRAVDTLPDAPPAWAGSPGPANGAVDAVRAVEDLLGLSNEVVS